MSIMEKTNEVLKDGWYVEYMTEISGAGIRSNRKFFETIEETQAFYDRMLARLQNMKEDGLIDSGEIKMVEGVKVSVVTYKEIVFQLESGTIQSYHV